MRIPIILLLILSFTSKAQVNIKDSVVNIPILGFNYSMQFPGGDMVKRFGQNSRIGGEFLFKTKSNYIFGIDWNYIFGNKVKEQNMFDSITTNTGDLIGRDGFLADLNLFERGFLTSLKFGKMFSVLAPNPNSGIVAIGGVGLLQHKIRIEDVNKALPQLDKDYRKGYDRLSNGLALSGFLGYIYLSNKRMINFYGGFEYVIGFTQSRRSWDFDKMKRDTEKRTDILYGFKLGWILPLYKKAPKEYYYY